MTVLPVLCSSCGAVSFRSDLVGVGGRATVTITRNDTRCQSCGGEATILDGHYRANDAMLTNPQQIRALLAALREIDRLIANQATPSEIENAIDEKYPFLVFLKKYIPKDFSELTTGLAELRKLIQLIFGIYLFAGTGDMPIPDIHVQEVIRDAIHDISSKISKETPADRQTDQANKPIKHPR